MLSLCVAGCDYGYVSYFILADKNYDDSFFFINRHLMHLIIGIVAFLLGFLSSQECSLVCALLF